MAKKKKSEGATSAAVNKKKKAAQKVQRKEQKKGKSKRDTEDDDDQDLEAILAKLQQEWEEAHKVTQELVEGPPSRRANATLTVCPNGNHLWCIGGEFFSDDGKAHFYNDVFRYSPDKDEWRKFISPNSPGPRSAHAAAATPIDGGKIFLFGGEFSSLRQNTFLHYRDFWCLNLTTHSWDRIETKIRPSPRSGHRMAVWKHYIVLFGGFYDPGVTTRYLNDLWIFSIYESKWREIEFKDTESRPSPRSGFSFLSTPEGIILHGGYCKEYSKLKRPVGVMLEDTWLLRMSLDAPADGTATSKSADLLKLKWEKRKRASTAYAPSLRSGCTMAAWSTKSMGILFGGVTDEDTGEETLESVFHNDLNGYQWNGKGKWVSMALRRPKKSGGQSKKSISAQGRPNIEYGSDEADAPSIPNVKADPDPGDPNDSLPLPRYNAMLAVLRNTLYIYGGIYERGSREYTLDDFYCLQLDKMDFYVCLKKSEIVITEGDDESSDDEDDDEEDEGNDEDGDDEGDQDGEDGEDDAAVPEGVAELIDGQKMKDDIEAETSETGEDTLRSRATAFMGVSKDNTRSAEEILRTPLPGETLATYYLRSKEYWAQKAHESSKNRGKLLRRDGFTLAEEHYADYKPILREVEKILAEAGLDADEMKSAASAAGGNRNRR